MKKSIFTVLSAAVLMAASASFANATPSACSGQDVVAGLSCTLGGLTFTFELVKFTPASSIDALGLSSPPTTAGNPAVLGFTVLGQVPLDVDLIYKVTSTSNNIIAIDSTYGPPLNVGTIFESACPTDPAVIPPGCGTPYASVTNSTGAYTISSTFGPVSTVYIDKDIEDFGFSEFSDSVEDPSVPEPMAMSLVGGGLALLGLLRFRSKKS